MAFNTLPMPVIVDRHPEDYDPRDVSHVAPIAFEHINQRARSGSTSSPTANICSRVVADHGAWLPRNEPRTRIGRLHRNLRTRDHATQ